MNFVEITSETLKILLNYIQLDCYESNEIS